MIVIPAKVRFKVNDLWTNGESSELRCTVWINKLQFRFSITRWSGQIDRRVTVVIPRKQVAWLPVSMSTTEITELLFQIGVPEDVLKENYEKAGLGELITAWRRSHEATA